MKTRPPDADHTHGLPPPPAPTARDANPWPISSRPAAPAAAPGKPLMPRGRAAAGHRPADPGGPGARRARMMPLLVLVFIAIAAVQLAIGALAAGELEGVIAAVVVVGMTALIAVRLLTKRKR